jgi:hypothetical protein
VFYKEGTAEIRGGFTFPADSPCIDESGIDLKISISNPEKSGEANVIKDNLPLAR